MIFFDMNLEAAGGARRTPIPPPGSEVEELGGNTAGFSRKSQVWVEVDKDESEKVGSF